MGLRQLMDNLATLEQLQPDSLLPNQVPQDGVQRDGVPRDNALCDYLATICPDGGASRSSRTRVSSLE